MQRSEINTVLERGLFKSRLASIFFSLVSRIDEFPREARTLLYGYDNDGKTRHVYLSEGWKEVVAVAYGEDNVIIETFRFPFETPDNCDFTSFGQIIPNKRLRPEVCDFDLCCLLAEHGYHLSFAAYTNRKNEGSLWGLTAPAA